MSDESASYLVQTRIPTPYGDFMMRAYDDAQRPHLALSYCDGSSDTNTPGELDKNAGPPLVRIHSECMTGDLFGSLRCDCGPQLQRSFEMIEAAGRGVIIYLRQEGRGIGLTQKLAAYNLQDQGLDTIDANLRLGHPADARDFGVAAAILKDLGHSRIRLLTNNPEKLSQLTAAGIEVTERVSLDMASNRHNADYLITKQVRMGHMLQIRTLAGAFGGPQ